MIEGTFGDQCANCHSTRGWQYTFSTAKAVLLHDKTDFPLAGANRQVACKACHTSGDNDKLINDEIEHARCDDCHADAHFEQLTSLPEGRDPADCGDCHDANSFLPTTYEAARHQETAYALKGAHRVVACNLCHSTSARLKDRDTAPKNLLPTSQPPRKSLRSYARLKWSGPLQRCETCHRDHHNEQFADVTDGCTACHTTTSFTDVDFDHNRDSRFPLLGKHGDVVCGACHQPSQLPLSGGSPIQYRPMSTACASCHPDHHLGQFDKPPLKDGDVATNCERCHSEDGFSEVLFNHDHEQSSSFALHGKHSATQCGRCHFDVALSPNESVARYKPLPHACAGCHIDPHSGTFNRYTAQAPGTKLPVASQTDTAAAANSARCDECHSQRDWLPVEFPHVLTGFELTGRHQQVACGGCHKPNAIAGPAGNQARRTYPLPTGAACVGCHFDAHRRQMGTASEQCHNTTRWSSDFPVGAHDRTAFPLIGRHAMIPCQECHGNQRESDYSTGTLACFSCHQTQYDNTSAISIDHRAANFSTQCRDCHNPWSFRPARFPAHEVCFPIAGGDHAGIDCLQCHTLVAVSAATGGCNLGTAQCTSCHEHRCSDMNDEHRGVARYECNARSCYECHPNGDE